MRPWILLHAVLWMAVVALAAARYTLGAGVAAAALGALLGSLAGPRLAASRLRSWALPLPPLGCAGAAFLLSALVSRWAGPARFLGSRNVYALAECLTALALPFALVAAQEALARRHPAWRIAGLTVLGALFASLFAAHREGFLNRPYVLVDFLWGHGLDPLPWFLLLGLALAALLAVTLAGPGRRAMAGTAMLVAVLAALFLALPQRHLKEITELHRVQGDGQPREGGAGSPKGGEGKDAPMPPDSFENQSEPPSDSVLAVVVFHNDYTPPLGEYYFRETAFSAFNGVRLVQDAGGRFDRDLPEPGARALRGGGREVRTTVAVMAAHARPFGLVGPVSIRETGNPDPKRFFQAYDVVSRVCETGPRDLVEAPLGDPAWDDAAAAHYTEGPPDPRYRELADRILETLRPELRGHAYARALAIKLWMDANTTYSLDTLHGGAADPVADFLFGDRRGHCVYLAHAACLLYRAAGVPARVAAGYAVDPEFRFGGASLMLRASNAHAWPEVRLRDFGWTPLDISPAKSEVPPQEAPDKDLQQMLGEMAMSEKPPPPPPPAQDQQNLRERLAWLARLLGMVLLAAAVLVLPAAYAVKLWRRFAPAFCRPEHLPRVAYRAALDAASARGLVRARGETREAFGARVQSPAFAALTARHLRWALGAPGPAPDCRDLAREARAQLRAGASPARRLLSLLNPLAWARVH